MRHRARELYCHLSATDNVVLLKSYSSVPHDYDVTIRRLSGELAHTEIVRETKERNERKKERKKKTESNYRVCKNRLDKLLTWKHSVNWLYTSTQRKIISTEEMIFDYLRQPHLDRLHYTTHTHTALLRSSD